MENFQSDCNIFPIYNNIILGQKYKINFQVHMFVIQYLS